MSSSSTSSRLSVAIIVRDAAEALQETLRSISGLADEVVVLDTGSTDGTAAVAQQHGAKVVSGSWNDDFGAARNACARHARGQWLLWLDAGETLSADDRQRLRTFVDTEAHLGQAYALLVKVPRFGSDIAAEQVARVRLVPHYPDLLFTGRVRETLAPALLQRQLRLEGIPICIQRGKREHDPHVKRARAQRNLHLATLEMKNQEPQARLLNCLGEALQILRDDERAAQCYRHAIDISERGSLEMLEAYYGLLTSLDHLPQGRQAQLSLCLEALEIYPLDAQLLCAMGGYLQAQGRLDLATRAYQTAHQHGTVEPQLWHLDGIGEIATVCYSVALQLQKRTAEARDVLEHAIARTPQATTLRRQLIDLYVQSGLRDEALAQVAALPGETTKREALRSAIRGACLAVQQNWMAARAYLQTAYTAGCRDPLCLRWLAVTLAALQLPEELTEVLEQWQLVDPASPELQKCLKTLGTEPGGGAPSTGPASPDRHLRLDQAAPPIAPEHANRQRSRSSADSATPHNR